jgi:Terminase RNaseH-like domain
VTVLARLRALPATLASLVMPSGDLLVDVADPRQIEDVAEVLDPDPRWRRHWIGAPRGWGKTLIAAAMVICAGVDGILKPGERGFVAAVDRDQARLIADAVRGFVLRTPGLSERVTVEQNRIVFTETGVEVLILSSDAASGMGLTGAIWIVEELGAWPSTPAHEAWYETISTSWPKVSSCRVVIVSTAGSPGSPWFKVHENAVADDRWRCSETHEPPPWIAAEDVAEEERRLAPGSFNRLWRNLWTSAEDNLVSEEHLQRCVTLHDWPLGPRPGAAYAVGVDPAAIRDNAAIAVAHAERRGADTVVFLDDLHVLKPTRDAQVQQRDIEDHVEYLAHRYSAPVFVDPGGGGTGIIQSLVRRGVRAEAQPVNSSSNDRMASQLHRLLREGLLALPAEPDLLDELRTVRLVENRLGALRLDHHAGRHDDMACAISYAVANVLAGPATMRGRIEKGSRRTSLSCGGGLEAAVANQNALAAGKPTRTTARQRARIIDPGARAHQVQQDPFGTWRGGGFDSGSVRDWRTQ